MPEDAESQPVKRGPGRPRKVAAPKVDVSPPADEWKTSAPVFPADERIGQHVDDPNWTAIVFQDDRQYRIEDGVIVERVR
jgi:hypothetical protein